MKYLQLKTDVHRNQPIVKVTFNFDKDSGCLSQSTKRNTLEPNTSFLVLSKKNLN